MARARYDAVADFYVSTLRRHDLWLDQLAEPRPAPDWDQAHDADRKPVFLVIRAVKMTADPLADSAAATLHFPCIALRRRCQ